jgi:hypothetical protein
LRGALIRALKIFDRILQGLGPWRDIAVKAQLAEPQGCGWSVRAVKIFAGKNTKTSGIEPQIVLRASAIDRCELAVLLNAQSAFE